MDYPFYLDYRARVSGTPRVGTQPGNPYARATADDFYQSQLTRGSDYASGAPDQIPHYGYLAAPDPSLWISGRPHGSRCAATGPRP
eukprot:8759589-Pyramimonas_sp.AAC.1